MADRAVFGDDESSTGCAFIDREGVVLGTPAGTRILAHLGWYIHDVRSYMRLVMNIMKGRARSKSLDLPNR